MLRPAPCTIISQCIPPSCSLPLLFSNPSLSCCPSQVFSSSPSCSLSLVFFLCPPAPSFCLSSPVPAVFYPARRQRSGERPRLPRGAAAFRPPTGRCRCLLGTWLSGGLGSARLTVGLRMILLQPKRCFGSLSVSVLLPFFSPLAAPLSLFLSLSFLSFSRCPVPCLLLSHCIPLSSRLPLFSSLPASCALLLIFGGLHRSRSRPTDCPSVPRQTDERGCGNDSRGVPAAGRASRPRAAAQIRSRDLLRA